jgi:hypothetical protein
MARRVVLALGYVGSLLFLIAGLWALLGLEFVCLSGCQPAAVPDRVLRLALPAYLLYLLPGSVAMLVAWIVCLVLLRRTQWRGWFRVVFAAPLLIFLTSAVGITVTWSIVAQTSWKYRTVAEGSYPIFMVAVMASILLTLVSNLIVIVAGHALRRATPRAAPARGHVAAGARNRSASD